MAITRVNKLGVASTSLTGQSSLTLTVAATTTAHNRIIVAAYWGANNPTTTVTDSQGNNYTQDAVQLDGVGGAATVFSSRADTPLASGVDTITITWTGNTVGNPQMAAYEYSGLANFGALDQSLSAKGSSNSPSSGSVTTQFANELVFGVVGFAGTVGTSLPAYTQLDQSQVGTHTLETQEDIVAATGSYAVTLHLNSSESWAAIIATYGDTPNSAANGVVNTTAPAITGSGVVGMQLTCSQGSWSNTPTAYAYQWKRAGVNITGATGAHYLVTTTDVGNALSCVVTASNKYGPVAATSSNTVTPAVKKVVPGLGI